MQGLHSFVIPVMVQAKFNIFSTMESIIVTTQEDLRNIVKSAFFEAQQELKKKAPQRPEIDTMTPREAVDFLASIGYPITLNTLRCRVSCNIIPSSKCNGRRILSRRELAKWVESNTRASYEAKERAAEQLSRVAQSRI